MASWRGNNVLGLSTDGGKGPGQLVPQREQICGPDPVLQTSWGRATTVDEAVELSGRIRRWLEEDAESIAQEVNKLSKQPFGSAEGAVIRIYLDVCLEMPWNVTTKERVGVDAPARAERALRPGKGEGAFWRHCVRQ